MKLENYLLLPCRVIIILFPFLLIKSGSADVACVVLGVLYLTYCIYKKDFKYFKNFYFIFFFLVFFYININSFFSFKPEISFQVSLAYSRIILFIVALSFFFKEFKNLKCYFYYSFLICIIILLLGSIFQILSHLNLSTTIPDRISSFFGSKLIMGSYLARLLPLVMGIGILLNFKKLNFFILFISSVLIFLSAERVAAAYFVLFCLFYLYLCFNFKSFVFSIFFFIIIFLSFFLIFPKNYERLFIHTKLQLAETKSLGLSYRHSLHYHTAWKMFLDRKIIGHGLKSFRLLCDEPKFTVKEKIIRDNLKIAPLDGYANIIESYNQGIKHYDIKVINDNNEIIFQDYVKKTNFVTFFIKNGERVKKDQLLFSSYEYFNGCNTHPHNIYLQFLAELGILGLFFFLTLYLYTLFKLYVYIFLKKPLLRSEKCLSLVLFGIFLNMFPLFPSGNYFNNWLLIITYFPIGFYLYLIKNKDV